MDVKCKNFDRLCRIKIGEVSVMESNLLYGIFKHLNSLEELDLIITDTDEEYMRFQEDLQLTRMKFHLWWDTMSESYGWDGHENGHWEIDFETCEIFLSE